MSEVKPKKCTHLIGYWLSEKKRQKMNWADFGSIARKNGFDLVKLDLTRPLEDQGPFSVIIHKLTDIIAKAGQGDPEAQMMIYHVECYVKAHPEVIVLDPLFNVQRLLERYHSYSVVHNSDDLSNANVFIPTFVELVSDNVKENIEKLKSSGVKFPFICKSSYAHGSNESHQMALIFNEASVKNCRPPCVAQTFINHNAVLYKIYIVGDKFSLVKRPSIKNFYTTDHETIFFNSHAVSKPDSSCSLNILDPDDDKTTIPMEDDPEKFEMIVKTMKKEFNMALLGVDVVIENGTGRYGIIDINAFPGYEEYSNFFDQLMDLIIERVAENLCSPALEMTNRPLTSESRESSANSDICPTFISSVSSVKTSAVTNGGDQDDSGFDTSDSSDERKKKKELEISANGRALGSMVKRKTLAPDNTSNSSIL